VTESVLTRRVSCSPRIRNGGAPSDLDVHQGNGHERDKLMMQGDIEAFILDAYRTGIYPNDRTAARAIDLAVELTGDEDDEEYLRAVQRA